MDFISPFLLNSVQLQAKAARAEVELSAEREQFKALVCNIFLFICYLLRLQIRFVDRLKRRGREYVEIQKKANMLVTSTANLNMSSINHPGHLHQHIHHGK